MDKLPEVKVNQTVMFCKTCKHVLTKEDFRPKYRKWEKGTCAQCEDAMKEAENEGKRKANAKNIANAIVGTIKGRETAPHVADLAAKLIQKAGGMDRFCDDYMLLLKDNEASVKVKSDIYKNVTSLIRASTPFADFGKDLSELSTDELHEEVLKLVQLAGDRVGFDAGPPSDYEADEDVSTEEA